MRGDNNISPFTPHHQLTLHATWLIYSGDYDLFFNWGKETGVFWESGGSRVTLSLATSWVISNPCLKPPTCLYLAPLTQISRTSAPQRGRQCSIYCNLNLTGPGQTPPPPPRKLSGCIASSKTGRMCLRGKNPVRGQSKVGTYLANQRVPF